MSLQLVLAHAMCSGWTLSSFDIKGAYLYSPVKETVFLEPPTYFCPQLKGKALRHEASGQMLVVVPVGHPDLDGLCGDGNAVFDFKRWPCAEVDIKWHNIICQIVGLECAFGEDQVAIAQRRLTKIILDSYSGPIVKNDCPLSVLPPPNIAVEGEKLDATPFRLVIGSLAYLVSGSCPDLAFAVNYLALTKGHWDILDHVVGYLLKTQHHRLVMQPGKLLLNLWSDASWGGALERCQTGFMLKLGEAPILWSSKRQGVVALSTCVAEYVALSNSAQHLVQAISQLGYLTQSFNKTIFCDNQAAVQVLIDNLSRKQMQYLDCAFFL
ncbi:hypothetical protein O181_012921 [Austropuccinia psidii MF-1]|uniref:Reverse transcriptase Ty1/copia-type domain-containing protein n=1 Tax=Austropuccinia psidii MF-1 TaxID=1389203 RepID=A0A9Q3BVG0_9BASI|nr:hypothetical protein [Austropuccinia psidii MF-1]